ncbi:MAG: hypothetical protein IT342_22365, partial [Candidatus Melainabacteria bacterium]|nr:hypothetical protein [Candidatus Melainabacteria bacterium]
MVEETVMGMRLEPSAAGGAPPNYSLIAGAYFPDFVPEIQAGKDARLCQSGVLADSLLVKPKEYCMSSSGEMGDVVTGNQILADRMVSRFFEPAF